MNNPDTTKFLQLAAGDLADARRMVLLQGFRESSIGFLLQQATEKMLKAWLYKLGQQAPFTHDLALLMGLVDQLGGRTNRYASLIGLGIFAVQLRYDDQPDLPMPPWADMLDLVEQLLQEVESTTEVDLNKGLFGVPDWEDWTT